MDDLKLLVDQTSYELLRVENPEMIDDLLDLLEIGVTPKALEKQLKRDFPGSTVAFTVICAYYHLARKRGQKVER